MFAMRTIIKALIGGAVATLIGWIGWGVYATRSTSEIPYEQVVTVGDIAIRRYPGTVRVETTASSQRIAFQRLYDYPSGANTGDAEITMTTPVETRPAPLAMTAPVRSAPDTADGGVQMAFYLPPTYDAETAPVPTDPDVDLVTESPTTVAVDSFSWYAPAWRVTRRIEALQDKLAAVEIEAIGEPYLQR